MKKIFFVLILILALTGCKNEVNKMGYEQITQDKAVQMMADEKDYIILDVRTAEEYAQGHIENAINIANEVIADIPLTELPDKNQLIMVYCRSGRRSKEAAEKLVNRGYTNVYEFGGILTWEGKLVK